MARYNTVIQTSTLATGQSVGTPAQGLYTEFTGIGPFTVQLASPVIYLGSSQTFYNATSGPSGDVTLSTTTNLGYIQGPGQTSTSTAFALSPGATCTIYSDGTNYQLISVNGANTFVNNLTANGTVSIQPVNASVTISPSGTGTVTMAPATKGTINNVDIGTTTAANATVNTLTLNTSLTGSGTISGGTF